jgi:hypothetical protein
MGQNAHPKASFGVGKVNVPGVMARATFMHNAFVLAAALFAALPISMADFLLLIQAAAAAQAATVGRTVGLASARDTKINALWSAMSTLKTYVQGLANSMDPASARSLIESAGLVVAQAALHAKLLVSATYVPATGIVHLSVNAKMLIGKRTSKKTDFTWSWSTDGGKTWSAGVKTSYTSHDVPGLPPASYLFRVFATVGKVPGDPVQSDSLTIH